MKKLWTLSARNVAAGFICWLAVTDLLVGLTHLTDWWLCKVVLFICISFLPGAVILLRILRITLRIFSVGALYSFGLSLLVLILSGLGANQILHIVGVARPLELWGVLGVWNIVTVALIVTSICMNSQPLRFRLWRGQKFSKPVLLFIVLSILLPFGAVAGAFRLNNGGDALFAELTLCYAAGLMVYVFLLRHRLPNELLAWFIFVMGLTVLLMTSLRGWDIVGHDIEREFRVYTLTHMHGYWDIALYRDPYNACLSITILPEMFARLLNMSGLMVFKVTLQVIFAACPVVVYMLLRQYASKLGALMGAMLFICYPTFINDSAMLTRQGVAYLFFALALLVISNRAQKKRFKSLFVLCSLGAVLSHYSTAYMFVALFAVAVVFKLSIAWWQARSLKRSRSRPPRTVLSLLFAGLLLSMTFVWYSQITGTSGGLITTFQKSFANIPKLFSSDNKSSDTSTALFLAGGKTQVDLYESYLTVAPKKQVIKEARATQYMPSLISDDAPLTSLGKKAYAVGIKASLITTLRQNFAKILQLLTLVGVPYATYRLLRRKSDALDFDFICLSLAGLVLLVLMVLLPILSINYGVLRAFQQTLIFLILPITLLLARATRRFWGWFNTTLATFSIVLLFLLFTGLFAQLLGGVSPTLSMQNRGLYHGLYYSSAADMQSFAWLKEHVPRTADVRAANFNRALMHDPAYPFARSGILPSQIEADSFVYLDQAQIQAQKFYTYFESSPLILTFPLDYYDTTENQIYSTTSTRVYR